MKKLLFSLSVALSYLFIVTGSAAAQGIYASGTNGVDVSYPNCNASIPYSAAFGIVGVTGGLGFHPNNCLAAEASKVKNLSLYVNTGYPGSYRGLDYQNSPKTCDASDLNCLAYNYGYNAGLYALSYARSQGASSTMWWLDVETMNSWTADTAQNIQSLQGETDALRAAGVATVGVYSTTAQWGTITGSWQNGLPNWGASTWTTARQASRYCTGHQFNGGPTYLIQYKGKLDQDYAC